MGAEHQSTETLYAIANGPRRPSLEALEVILQALRAHSLQVTLPDIVRTEFVEDDDSDETYGSAVGRACRQSFA